MELYLGNLAEMEYDMMLIGMRPASLTEMSSPVTNRINSEQYANLLMDSVFSAQTDQRIFG